MLRESAQILGEGKPRRQLTLEHGFSSLTLSLSLTLLVLINGDPRWATRAIRQFLAVNLRGALPWFPRLHHCHRQIFSGLSLSPPHGARSRPRTPRSYHPKAKP